MADDMSTRTTSKRRGRGPLVVMNPADADYSRPSPPLLSGIDPPSSAQTPSSSDQPLYGSPPYFDRPYDPPRTVIPETMLTYGINRSPPSPSDSSSHNIESSPPPSTPSQGAPSLGFNPDEGVSYPESSTAMSSDDRSTVTPSTINRVHYFSKIKFPNHRRKTSNHRLTPSETFKDICVMVTSDTDSYIPLIINGTRDAAAIKEMIFTKLKISDEDQQLFSIHRTEIGSTAPGEKLSDDMLMKVIHEEGDSRGTLKLLAQHSAVSATSGHLSPSREVVSPHVPPVFTNPGLIGSSGKQKTPSNHDSKSSTSEPFAGEQHNGYDGSASDDLDRFGLSPSREAPGNYYIQSRNRPSPSQPPYAYSPASSRFDESTLMHPPPPPATRGKHSHSGSETAADRERMLEASEKRTEEFSRRREDRARQDSSQGRSSRPLDRPSTTDSRQTPNAAQITFRATPLHPENNGRYAQTPSVHRSALPPVPSSARGSSSRNPNQPIPAYLFKALAANSPQSRSSPQRQNSLRSYPKSMGDMSLQYKQGANSSTSRKPSNGNTSQRMKPVPPSFPDLASGSLSSPFIHTETMLPRDHLNPPATAGVSKSFDSKGSLFTNSTVPPRSVPTPSISHGADGQSFPPRLQPYSQPLGSAPGSSFQPPSTWPNHDEPYTRPHSSINDYSDTPVSIPVRPLPPTGRSEIDNDDMRSPRGIGGNPLRHIRPVPSVPQQLNRHIPNGSSSSMSGVVDLGSELERPKSREPRSPESPRRLPSPGQGEGSNSTLRPEHIRITDLLSDTSSESTLMPNRAGRQDRELPRVPSFNDVSGSHISTSEDDDSTEEDDSDNDEGGGTLWQPRSRPHLVVDTQPSIPQTRTQPNRNSPWTTPPFPPPNFPPPPPPPAPKKQKSSTAPKRDSSFVKNSNRTWAFRPPAEEMYDRLEEYFPDHDLDKPVIEAGGSSPTTIEQGVPALSTIPSNSSAAAAEKEKRFKHKKSIRLVAAEHKKKIDRTSRCPDQTAISAIHRRNTKLWGHKLEEVTSSQGKFGVLPPPPDSPPGSAKPKPIFRWVRGELIGKGTYGRVYLALNATTGEMIAVKQVEIPKTESDRSSSRQINVVEALKMESETLKDLDHPNIVQYLGFEETPDFLSIFLEYVPGGSVAFCLRKHGKFEDSLVRSFTSQILSGLEYLHLNGIIHRDLKADNILVDPSGVCKISDFGISKRTDDINLNGEFTSMTGSVFWMAPEVVRGKVGYNGKVDIWSLGCVVLEMWAGRRPWEDQPAIAVIYELVTNHSAPPVPVEVDLSPEADDFRLKCFAVKPDDRPSASELRKHPYLELQPGWSFTGFS